MSGCLRLARLEGSGESQLLGIVLGGVIQCSKIGGAGGCTALNVLKTLNSMSFSG